MEQFEAIVHEYPAEVNIKIVTNAVETIRELLKEDLAAFEKEWITECLFSKPMEILMLISQKKHEDAWNKVIEKSFEMLGEMVQAWSGYVDPYAESLVKTSIQSFTPHIRKRGIQCVTSLVKSSIQAEVSHTLLLGILADTDETLSSRVPVAELIGVICERRPEAVGNIYKDIWRTYLCVLENSKLTDSLIGGVLSGMNGLFKEFGEELPIVELNGLYERMTSSYIHKKSCRMACIDLLSNHCQLFREKVIQDPNITPALWNVLTAEKSGDQRVITALYNLYELCLQPGSADEILITDLYPKTRSEKTQIKNTAYKIISKCIGKYRSCICKQIVNKFDRDVIEMSSKVLFQANQKLCALSGDAFQLDHAFVQCMDEACWLAPLPHNNSANLFRLLVLGYSRTPRRTPVAHCLLTSHAHRAEAISFLISETCALTPDGCKTESFALHQALWRDLFDSRSGTDLVVLENALYVFDDFVNYLTSFMETLLDNDANTSLEGIRARLSVVLELAECVMQMENVREWRGSHTGHLLALALELLDTCGMTAGMLRLLPTLLADLAEQSEGPLSHRCADVCTSLDISRCSNEALLCATCLALVNIPVHFIKDINIMLEAFKLIFSRNDVEAKVLVSSLDKFKTLLENGSVKINEPIVNEIIILIKKLYSNIKVSDQHGRLLRRNILLFIGKYGTILNEHVNPDVIVLRHIKDSLFLHLPNYVDGSGYKLYLQKILRLAIAEEDAESLHALLLILCANAEGLKKVHEIESVVVCVIHKLCRCHSRGQGAGSVADLEQAALLFPCAPCVSALLQCIITELSPGVRKMLSDILTSILQHDPLSDATEEAVKHLMERCCLMLQSALATTKRAGLDLTPTLLETLRNNNALTQQCLPDLLTLTLRTQERDLQTAFDAIAHYFKEKSQLFDKQVLDKIIDELFKTISEAKYNNLVYESVIVKSLNIIKYIYSDEDNNETIFELYTKYFTIKHDDKIEFAKAICVLSKMSTVFDFNQDLKRIISQYDNFVILQEAGKWSQSFYNRCYDIESYFLFESFLDLLIEYSQVFLEFKFQNTLELLSILISTLPVIYLKRLCKKIERCINCFRENRNGSLPHAVTNSMHMWLKTQQVDAITDQLHNCIVLNDNATIINGIKLMLKIMRSDKNESIFCDEIYDKIKSWVGIIKNLHNRHFETKDKFKMAALSDSVEVSLYFMTDNEIIKLIIDSQNVVSNNLTFYQKYIAAFTHCLLCNKVLSDERLAPYLPVLLYEILVYFGKKNCTKEECEIVLDLVNKNWSIIEESPLISALSMTTALSKLPHKDRIRLGLRPATWLMSRMQRDDVAVSQRIVFMETLTGFLANGENSELLSSAVQSHSAALPTRLSELSSRSDPRAFTVVLDAVAVHGNRTLLDAVYWMVLAEESSGWWDEAVDQCMSSLANRNDINMAMAIYDNYDCCQIYTVKPISQMLVPLLRYSTSKFNEEFFSKTIPKILECLNRTYKDKTTDSLYSRMLTKQTASFMLLQVMFQKVSAASLESASSLLHRNLNASGRKPWSLAAAVCSLCVTLRQPCCFDSDQTKLIHRIFQCSNYNCMVSVLCKRKPAVKFYERLFQDHVWPLVFDCDRTYTLYIDAQGNCSKKRHLVEASMENLAGLSATTNTVRSYNPLFLRTLSDNPLNYDLLEHTAEEEEVITQEIILRDNELNAHPCVSSISALLCHLTSLTDDQAPYWITKMAATVMADDTPVNVKWFLSQIIVNSKEELRKYSSLLMRPLADVVIKTVQIQDGHKYLNGLHIDILKTLHSWSREAALCTDVLSQCARLLVDTCYFHRRRKLVRKAVLAAVELLVRQGGRVPLEAVLRDCDDTTKEVSLEIQILLTKNKIYIPGLLKHLTDNIKHFDTYPTKTIELAKLFGLAVRTCQSDSEKSDSLRKFHAFLDKKRSNFNDYIKIVYYAQAECHECVNDKCFSHITDLAPKMTSAHKNKCYTILSNYISHVRERDDHIIEMFASINIPEYILEKDAYIGINIAKNGFHLLGDSVKKQIIFLVCEVCENCHWKVRKVSCELLLNAYKDILNEQPSEPPAKRVGVTKASNIISCVTSGDAYPATILGTLGRAVTDAQPDISTLVFDGFLEILDKHDLAMRFCEIVALTMVLPFSKSSGGGDAPCDVAGLCARAVSLWVRVFRDNHHYQRNLLRENPVLISSSLEDDGPSRLLTMSKTYQGTFRTNPLVPSRNARGRVVRGDTHVLNVQVPVDVLLEKFIGFAENNVAASSELFLQVFRMVVATCNAPQIRSLLAELATRLLQISPPVMLRTATQMARDLMDQCVHVEGFVACAERLQIQYAGSEAEAITSILHEEAMLHTDRPIVLSSINEDFTMMEPSQEFSIKDLADTFGKLCDWDELTLQSAARLRDALPPLWTDPQRFRRALDNYSAEDWLRRARDVCRGDTRQAFVWLGRAGTWPISYFQLSTLTEATDIRARLLDEDSDLRLSDLRLSDLRLSDVRPSHCLARWSARLMLRSVMIKQLSPNCDRGGLYCRSSELKWCAEANRRGLDSAALLCVKRNASDLVESEAMPWLLQQAQALRSSGLRLGRERALQQALDKCEKYLKSFISVADKETVLSMSRLILQLKSDMNLLSQENIDPILTEMSDEFTKDRQAMSEHVISDMIEAYKIAFHYYCDNLDNYEESQYVIKVKNTMQILKQILNLKLMSNLDGPVACVLQKLEKVTNIHIYSECATVVFGALEDHVEYLDNILVDEFKRIITKLPENLCDKFVKLQKRLFEDMFPANISRLKLLRSPEYTLEQHVTSLLVSLQKQDASQWNATFVKIQSDLYDVEYGGAAYRLLTKYTSHLEGIRTFDSSENFKKNAERVLKNVLKSLKPQEVKQLILLEDLCPSLCDLSGLGDAQRRALENILGIPSGLTLVRFEKQLKVFTNSVKRPVLVRALVSDGRTRTFLVKSGDDLRIEAAARRVRIAVHALLPARLRDRTYAITPLGTDAGIIEYLDDHVTVRNLLAKYYPNINQIAAHRVKDEQLILQTQNANNNQYKDICKKVPSFALRNCIINECESVEDFIMKKSNYLDTLSAMTVNHWILGLGDRHLENMLYDCRTGAVCAVDWAAILDHAVHSVSHSPELMPARLTRNILSVIQNIQLLESRLQNNLKCLRREHKTVTAIIRVAFKFVPEYNSEPFQLRLKDIENKLNGSVLPYQVTRRALSGSGVPHRQAYAGVLDELFGDALHKDTYTVEEQIYYMLRQCTDEKILQVTRSGWEPWL